MLFLSRLKIWSYWIVGRNVIKVPPRPIPIALGKTTTTTKGGITATLGKNQTFSEYDRLQKWIRENNALKDPATRKLITQPEETIEKILAESEADHVDFEGEHNDGDDDDNSDEETITEDEEGIVLISVAERLPKTRN